MNNGLQYKLFASEITKETNTKQEKDGPVSVTAIDIDISNKQLLYVEDNSANIKLMHSILEKQQGCILDVVRTGGVELTQKLKQTDSYKNIPIIAVSASAMKHDLELAEGIFEAYITKPIDVIQILGVLKKHLN